MVNFVFMNDDKFPIERNRVDSRRFRGGGRAELHTVLRPGPECVSFESQRDDLDRTLRSILASECEAGREMRIALKRCHLSDSVNQYGEVGGLSVGQPPAAGSRIEMLVILTESSVSVEGEASTMISRGSYSDLWFFRNAPDGEPLYDATVESLGGFDSILRGAGGSLASNCVRTWFWVRDIDAEYSRMVKGRNDVFKSLGLTPDTHFIASTGIGADLATPRTPLLFSALAVMGLDEDQIHYIKAPAHLNDTINYGVAFERATAIDYGDRRVVYVSGTASIDSHGEIFAPGDIVRQTERMCDNIDALLTAADCGPEDLMHAVLYVRDPADFRLAREIVGRRYPETPCLCVRACVCRPGWLVEMECMAMRPQKDDRYADY